MINRPMLLNLFGKANKPTLPDDGIVLVKEGHIPVMSFTLGSYIILSPIPMQRAFDYYNQKKVVGLCADFCQAGSSTYARTIAVVMRKNTSNKLWSILMPKDNNISNLQYDVYTQKSTSSNRFERQ